MKKGLLFFLLLSLTFMMIGCGGSNDAAPNEAAPAANGDSAPATNAGPSDGADQVEAPRATITPDAPAATEPIDSYPPPAPAVEAGYPTVMLTQPRADAYPVRAGYVWMAREAGEQCGDAELLTLSDAVAELQSAGVEVLEPHTASLAVCQACGCPTSLHFWAQVPEAGVETAVTLGWSAMEG